MEANERAGQQRDEAWAHIGRAAEDFARRIARDAGRFAERLEEHATEFARDASRDWRRARRHYRHSCSNAAAPDVRRIFEDVRGVLSDVLDGVDELIDNIFRTPAGDTAAAWVRMVTNRDVTCAACGRQVTIGDEVFSQRTSDAVAFRCVDCGPGAATS